MEKRLEMMKEHLMNCAERQITGNLEGVNAEELGEVVDMIKDLSETAYYCSIVEAMEKKNKESDEAMRYTYPPVMYNGEEMETRRMYSNYPRMYSPMRYNSMNYSYPSEIRDYREGRSPMMRRTYMESKEMHHDKAVQMQELEDYVSELTQDIMEMIGDATPEEKTILAQKLQTLANKIK